MPLPSSNRTFLIMAFHLLILQKRRNNNNTDASVPNKDKSATQAKAKQDSIKEEAVADAENEEQTEESTELKIQVQDKAPSEPVPVTPEPENKTTKADEVDAVEPAGAADDGNSVDTTEQKTARSESTKQDPAEKVERECTGSAASGNLESDKPPIATSDETASTKSESSKPEEKESEAKADKTKSEFTVSRVHGVGTVVVAPSSAEASQTSSDKVETLGKPGAHEVSKAADDNHDDWETVEVKGRGNRKKSGRQGHQHQSSHSGHNGSKKNKSTRNTAARRRVANRRLVKDILSSVLDSVEEEVKKQQQEARVSKTTATSTPAWHGKDGARAVGHSDGGKKETTLRDVVVGKQTGATTKKQQQHAAKHESRGAASKHQSSGPKGKDSKDKNSDTSSPRKRGKGQASGADQNTAPTVPETVSAAPDSQRATPNNIDRDITRSDSSSGGTEDNRKQGRSAIPTNLGKDSSPAPPLPTLLGPGNANSSSSSVASSLEAPHASHAHRHTSSANENDVGYHLLDVCDRLTRDMHVFMSRRSAALNSRRRERGALLTALQESVSVSGQPMRSCLCTFESFPHPSLLSLFLSVYSPFGRDTPMSKCMGAAPQCWICLRLILMLLSVVWITLKRL
jgi:hypothetical protein